MSLNDRCEEALEAIEAGASIDYPEVRVLVLEVMRDGRNGFRFPGGIREAALAIRNGHEEQA